MSLGQMLGALHQQALDLLAFRDGESRPHQDSSIGAGDRTTHQRRNGLHRKHVGEWGKASEQHAIEVLPYLRRVLQAQWHGGHQAFCSASSQVKPACRPHQTLLHGAKPTVGQK